MRTHIRMLPQLTVRIVCRFRTGTSFHDERLVIGDLDLPVVVVVVGVVVGGVGGERRQQVAATAAAAATAAPDLVGVGGGDGGDSSGDDGDGLHWYFGRLKP